MKIGVLAIQGGYRKHQDSLLKLKVNSVAVKYKRQLNKCSALIIPGGESTTISKLLKKNSLDKPISEFASEKPVMGTCAGLILMCKKSGDSRVRNLELIDVNVKRNGWGRQFDSFSKIVDVKGISNSFKALFIRAPKITNVGRNVQILSTIGKEPIFVKEGMHYGVTFHPELTEDTSIHKMFLESIAA